VKSDVGGTTPNVQSRYRWAGVVRRCESARNPRAKLLGGESKRIKKDKRYARAARTQDGISLAIWGFRLAGKHPSMADCRKGWGADCKAACENSRGKT